MVVKSMMAREIYSNFCNLVEKPEVFEEKSCDFARNLTRISKEIYDEVGKTSFDNAKTRSLRKLLIDGFDSEQVWQQVLLQNKGVIEHFNSIPKIQNTSAIEMETQSSDNENLTQEYFDSSDENMNDGQEYVFDDDDDSIVDSRERLQENQDVETSSEKEEEESSKQTHRGSYYKTPVDDQFFKLSKLEQFLHLEDLKEEHQDDDTFEKNKSDDEDDINLFQDIPSENSELSDLEELTNNKKSSKNIMYEDFFDAPDSGDENMKDDDFDQQDELTNNVLNEEFEEENTEEKKNDPVPTAFEIEQEKVQRKIAEYEEILLQPASWKLTGEIAASNRPVNSLVHEQTEFDVKSRPVIIEDHELFLKLESMAKLAIKNKAYDDGVRKCKTKAEEIAYKKEVILEQTKSKKGLAEVYEDDFLKKQKNQEEKEDPKHTEIKKLIDNLFPELHALFCHIPKPAVPDIKIVSNLPAVTVEEVAPTAVSDVTLLAPEEVKKKTGLVKDKSERTDTDKKRERRKKKLFQKIQHKKMEQKLEEKPTSAKARKQEKIDTIKKLKQFRNTKIAAVDDKKIKSSKDFFSQLQDVSDARKISQLKSSKKK